VFGYIFSPNIQWGVARFFERESCSQKSRIFTVNFKDCFLCSRFSRSISKIFLCSRFSRSISKIFFCVADFHGQMQRNFSQKGDRIIASSKDT
jgi:hypothetical protein